MWSLVTHLINANASSDSVNTEQNRKQHKSMSFHSGNYSMRTALLLCLLAHCFLPADSTGKCASSSATYTCPNPICGEEGGYQLTDCLDCDGYFNTDQSSKRCITRKLFNTYGDDSGPEDRYNFLWNDIVGTFVWFIGAGLATACGVGGGGIFVPLAVLLVGFASKPASGLSQSSIFGSGCGGLILNIKDTHPDTKIRDDGERDELGRVLNQEIGLTKEEIRVKDEAYLASGRKFYTRPLIDYDICLFLSPMEMAGAIMGVLIQKLLPNWLFLSVAAVILGITAYKTYQKFFAAYKKDKANREQKRQVEARALEKANKKEKSVEKNLSAEEKTIDEKDKSDSNDISDEKKEEHIDDVPTSDAEADATNTKAWQGTASEEELQIRRNFLEEDSRQYPIEKLGYLALLWAGLTLVTFLKGGKGVDSIIGITCESPVYAILIVFQFLWTFGFATVFGLKLVKKQTVRAKVNYPFLYNDVIWDMSKLRFYAGFTFVAGFVAGLIGIGGGMVLGPLMMVMGIHPRVSSATTATMIVLTSSSVAIMFVTSGLIHFSYAIYFYSVCFSGALIGKIYIDGYIKRTGMSSILIGILATIIAMAVVCCFVIVLINLNRQDWCLDGFKKFCDIKEDGSACATSRLLMGFLDE